MSPTRTDDDLERLLRATFAGRASKVTHGPGWTPTQVRTRHRWIAPVVAAALVLGVVATFVGLQARRSDSPPATPPAESQDLTSFPVPGYPVAGMLWAEAYRAVAVRMPGGHTAQNKADAIVFDFGTRAYPFKGFRSAARITVAGQHPGFRGQAPAIPDAGTHLLPTVVWNYAPGRWALVQSIDGRPAPSTRALLRLAAAARPDGHLTVTTAFRFSAVPAGYRVAGAQVVVSSQTTVLQLRNARGTMLTVTSTPVHSGFGREIALGAGVVRHGRLLLVIDASERHRAPSAADRSAAAFLRTHLVWERSTLARVVP